MTSIPGIYASQISGHLFAPSGAYDSIATTTVGAGGASTITFSSIPSTYTHLQIRFLSGFTSAGQAVRMRFNGDTSYCARHGLYGDGSSAGAYSELGQTSVTIYGAITGTSTTYPSVSITDVLDYTSTSKYKTTRAFAGNDVNGSGELALLSGLWMSTAAITSIDIFPTAGNFTQYSSFALYGIRGN